MHNALRQHKCDLRHAPRYIPGMGSEGDRLRRARTAAGYTTAKDAADAMGVAVSTYIQHENGSRGFPAKRADRYARFFRTSPEWLLYGRGDAPAPGSSPGVVPLVGYVGAGDAAHFYATADDPNEDVDAPEWANENTRAAEVRGTSLGPLLQGWLVYFDKELPGVPPEHLGHLCVVGLPDDRILVKQVRKGSGPNAYHLLSNNEPAMMDEEVVWSARVKEMRPR